VTSIEMISSLHRCCLQGSWERPFGPESVPPDRSRGKGRASNSRRGRDPCSSPSLWLNPMNDRAPTSSGELPGCTGSSRVGRPLIHREDPAVIARLRCCRTARCGRFSSAGAVPAPLTSVRMVHMSIAGATYTPMVRFRSSLCAVAFADARETLCSTVLVDSSLRKQMGERVRDFFADAIQAMGGAKRAQLALKNAGLRAPDGTEYSVRAVSSW